MVAQTFSATLQGIEGRVIKIEAAPSGGLPKIIITGLPGDVVKESRERVRACLSSLGFRKLNNQIVIHLSPASARKQGSQFDLGIAISVLCAEEWLRGSLEDTAFLGELGLGGKIRGVRGALSLIQALNDCSEIKKILISPENAEEAALVGGNKILFVEHLSRAIEFVEGKLALEPVDFSRIDPPPEPSREHSLDHVRGQSLAKRALQISLAGRHHLLMLGAPGIGKSMIAQCAPHLLPPLSPREFMEVMKGYDAAGVFRGHDRSRPFRSPHHSISSAGMVGGGSGILIPGEVTLAHAGVLFLDEFPEFRKDVIEAIREPMQSAQIHLHRIGHFHCLPARFTLIAAMNPCPCGYSLGESRKCRCPWERIVSYRKRISGPILDRMDLGVILSRPRPDDQSPHVATHEMARTSIARARETQRLRYAGELLNGDEIDLSSPAFQLGGPAQDWFNQVRSAHELSYRGLNKLIKVARTIADLECADDISVAHLREAWGLRCPDLHALNA